MVQLIAILFFTAALFAAVGVIAFTLQKSRDQIVAALRGPVLQTDLPAMRDHRPSIRREPSRRRPASSPRKLAA